MSQTSPRCPACHARLTLHPDQDLLWCQFCGASLDDPAALETVKASESARAASFREYDPPARQIDMTSEQRNTLNSAYRSILEGDMASARYILNTALVQQDDFADAWYLLSLTTDNRDDRLIYLEQALSAQPYHEYAWRDKGVLTGVIPADDAATDALVPDDNLVRAESDTHACPLCGGALVFDAAAGALICNHCHHQPGLPIRRYYRGGYDPLDNALLQRRFGFSREWHIGERVLVCQNCHAQLTLHGTTFSAQCPFCGSAHVLVQDAVGSFEEPDALLPFQLDRRAAARALHARLDPQLRPKVERGDILGIYLPFWAFEGLVTITLPPDAPITEPFSPGAFPISDVLVGGVTQPHQATLDALMPFDLRALAPYDARYLAQWPALVYQIDVIQASITGRACMKYAARQQATGYTIPPVVLARTDSSAYTLPDTPLWRAARLDMEALSYRLILLPVWMITLHLHGGAQRPAVVNGQTGEALLLKSFTELDTIVAARKRDGMHDLPLPERSQPVIRPLAPRRSPVIRPLRRNHRT